MRVTVVQPAAPDYRVSFFQLLYRELNGNLEVWASKPPGSLGGLAQRSSAEPWLRQLGKMRSLGGGLSWQGGAVRLPLRDVDVLVVCGEPRVISNMILLLRARILGVTTVWWGHYWSSTTRTHRFIVRWLLMRIAHALLFYTDLEVDDYRGGLGRFDKRIVDALNNGIDVEPIKRFRLSYESKQRDKQILFIGRLTDKANLALLLRALSMPSLQDVSLYVIGDGEEMMDLKAKCAELRLADRVEWLGSVTNEEEIARIANRSRIFVYPGSVGLSLVHSFAYGLPAVIHNDRWLHMPEFAAFSSEGNGRTFQVNSYEDLAKVISELIDDHYTLSQLSCGAIATSDKKFNTADMLRRFNLFLDRLKVRAR